jgi:predicted HNH restriction endonuclease
MVMIWRKNMTTKEQYTYMYRLLRIQMNKKGKGTHWGFIEPEAYWLYQKYFKLRQEISENIQEAAKQSIVLKIQNKEDYLSQPINKNWQHSRLSGYSLKTRYKEQIHINKIWVSE